MIQWKVRPVFCFVSQVKIQYEWSHHFFSLWELAVARRFVPMFDSSAGKLGAKTGTGCLGEKCSSLFFCICNYTYILCVFIYIYISNSYCFHRNHIFFFISGIQEIQKSGYFLYIEWFLTLGYLESQSISVAAISEAAWTFDPKEPSDAHRDGAIRFSIRK